jgi:hypothetical protein
MRSELLPQTEQAVSNLQETIALNGLGRALAFYLQASDAHPVGAGPETTAWRAVERARARFCKAVSDLMDALTDQPGELPDEIDDLLLACGREDDTFRSLIFQMDRRLERDKLALAPATITVYAVALMTVREALADTLYALLDDEY